MKILFENEKEREKIMDNISDSLCPSDVGLEDTYDSRVCPDQSSEICVECWKKSGIDIFVLPERRVLKKPGTFDDVIHNLYDSGFNACLDEILGGVKGND